jgi:UDP:flavonoid glycosyltransferase YjiC (YdhE family)
MAAPRGVLLAWELGGGYGHIHLMLPLADRLAAAGAQVTLAMRDPVTGRALLGTRPHALVQAPPPPGAIPSATARRRLESWADLMLDAGYADPAATGRSLASWRGLLQDRPCGLVVAEFAPGAMLAARSLGIPALAVGMGWNIPPAVTPSPALRFWDPAPSAVRQAAEDRLLAAVNPALAAAGGAPLGSLAALFDPDLCCLCTFPELDHFPDRGAADCFGAIYALAEGDAPDWPPGAGPRCFAYVNGTHPGLAALLAGIGAAGLRSVMHPRGSLPAGLAPPAGLRIAPGPVRMREALADRPVVICQGLHSMAAALAAGCPVLAVPEHLEQTVLANRLTAQGLGLALHPSAGAAAAAAALRRLAEDTTIRAAAARFADRYAGYAPELAVQAVAAECLDLLG